mmetsp:Transcript_15711/g.63271  ORF Transcript_15711/g.63271 Transcript_15711/m.63271 type:complete len:848 (-) Transcript_15711:2042-4585(-)
MCHVKTQPASSWEEIYTREERDAPRGDTYQTKLRSETPLGSESTIRRHEAARVRVPAGHARALGRERTVDRSRGSQLVGTRARDGVFDGEEGRGAEEEGRLADGARRVDGVRVGVVDEDDAHVERRVVRGGELVGAGPLGEELASLDPRVLLVAPDHLLEAEEAVALREGALDLPHVDGGIDRAAEVHDDVGAPHVRIAREHVELDFRARDARGEVVERLAARGVGRALGDRLGEVVAAAVVRDDVEALRRQVDAAHVGLDDELAPRDAEAVVGLLGELGAERLEALEDLRARVEGGHAVQVGRHRGRRGRRVGHLVGRGVFDVDLREVEAAEGVRDGLLDLGVEALAHLGAAVRDEDRAVGVDVDEGAALVEEFGGERDAEDDGDHGEAALAPRVGRVVRVDLGAPRGELGDLEAPRPEPGEVDVRRLDDLVVVRRLADGEEVALAERLGRHAERPREVGDVRFADLHALRPAEAAERRVGRRVGLAEAAEAGEVGHLVGVGAVEQRAVHDGLAEVERVARVAVERDVGRDELVRRLRRRRAVHALERVPLARDGHVDVAVERELARPAERVGGDGDGARQEGRPRLLAAEPAAHALRDARDLGRRDAEDRGAEHLRLGRVLRRRDDAEPAVLERDADRRVGLEIKVLLPADVDRALDRDDLVVVVVGFELRDGLVEGEPRGYGVVLARDGHQVRVRGDGVVDGAAHVVGGGDVAVLDDHRARRLERRVLVVGDDDADRLARRRDGRRHEALLVLDDGADLVGALDVFGRDEALHAAHRERRRRVDRRERPLGDRREHQRRVQAVVLGLGEMVVGVLGLARDLDARRPVRHRRAYGLGRVDDGTTI